MADTRSRVMLQPRDVERPGHRRALSRLESICAARPRAPRCAACRRRRSRAGGVRHVASQALHVRERSGRPRVALRGGAARGQQRSARARSCGRARARVVARGTAGPRSRARACRGGRDGAELRRRPASTGARRVRAVGGRGPVRARDRERARPPAQHHVLAHPPRASTLRPDHRRHDRAAPRAGRAARCGLCRGGAG